MPRRRSLPALVLLLLGLAACGAGGSGSATSTAATAAPATSTSAPATTSSAPAQKAAALALRKIGSFSSPVWVTSAPGDNSRLFVVEQGGTIRVIKNGKVLSQPFLDIRSRVTCCGEQGLLSLAFAPDYAKSGRFYVYYSSNGGSAERVEEFKRSSADRARLSSRRLVLRMADPEGNHNGGLLLFHDGRLFIGTGDGGGAFDQHGSRGNAQNLNSPLGKILRINPRPSRGRSYSSPSDNPFVGRAGRDEIWSYGLRNPWRYSFDRKTGDLVIGDVGQNAVEEIDFAAGNSSRGANYGWRPWEGRRRAFNEPAPGAVFPVITASHSDGYCSITGGYVVRDPHLTGWVGRYLYGDFCKGDILSAKLSLGKATSRRSTGLHVDQLSSFGEDNQGRLYAISLGGSVYRIAAR
jgi:glucose/arabinose dehydrogenase